MTDREKVRNGLRCLSGDKEMVENIQRVSRYGNYVRCKSSPA